MSEFISLPDAAKHLPGNPSPTSVWRLVRVGVRTPQGQVTLRAVRGGKRLWTTLEWIREFLEAQSAAQAAPPLRQARPTVTPASSRRQAQIAAAGIEAAAPVQRSRP